MSSSDSELSLTKSISRLSASKGETLAQFLKELAAKILELPGVKAFEIKPSDALSGLAGGPFLWTLGSSRKKPAGTVSAPIADGRWGELQIRFDVAHLTVQSPVRFARFAAQQIALVSGKIEAERRNQELHSQVEQLATDLDTRKFVQRAAGLLVRQRGIRESDATAMLRRHAVQTGRDLRQVAEAVITAFSRNLENPHRRSA